MSSTESQSTYSSVLRILDPELPLLASEAAIDVDNILTGSSIDQAAMRRLAEKLFHSIEQDASSNTLNSRMDMATLTVLGEAFSETFRRQSLTKVDDLLAKADQIAKVLASDDPRSNTAELEEARDFCVALSRAAAAYSDSIRNLRPPHPFRR